MPHLWHVRQVVFVRFYSDDRCEANGPAKGLTGPREVCTGRRWPPHDGRRLQGGALHGQLCAALKLVAHCLPCQDLVKLGVGEYAET
jgi:hypothetical protein